MLGGGGERRGVGCAGWGGGWGGVIVGGGSVGGGSVGGGWLLFYPLREKLETLKKYLLSYYLSTYLSLHRERILTIDIWYIPQKNHFPPNSF